MVVRTIIVISITAMVLLLTMVIYMTIRDEMFAGGTGSRGNPYLIATAEHLDKIRIVAAKYYDDLQTETDRKIEKTEAHDNTEFHDGEVNLVESFPPVNGLYFLQIADIDLGKPPWNEAKGWEPLERIHGYDGNGHVINNLYINRPDEDYVGLFSTFNNIKNLGLTNVNITGHNFVGSFIGSCKGFYPGQTSLEDCYSTGIVRGRNYVGGLAGKMFDSSIENCYSTAYVTGKRNVGGFLGAFSNSDRPISYFDSPYIIQSFFAGTIEGEEEIGAFVGGNQTNNVLSIPRLPAVLVEDTPVTQLPSIEALEWYVYESEKERRTRIPESIWNRETTGVDTSDIGIGYSTSEMVRAATYIGWDFAEPDGVWVIEEGISFPYLRWQGKASEHNIPYR